MVDPYMAFAIQPKVYGCRDRKEARKNLDNLCRQIDGCMYVGDMEYPAKLLAIPEGAITGFYDEHARLGTKEICDKIALRLPGEETEVLAEKARQWGIYIIAAAKVEEPDLFPGRFFNTVFIIDPSGKIVHRYRKHRVFPAEGSSTPYDLYDEWLEKVGSGVDAFFPVADTPIGRIGTLLAFDGKFPEAGRALALNGAEIIYRGGEFELHRRYGYTDVMNRAHAVNNSCYVIAPSNGPKYMDLSEDRPSMTGSVSGGGMIVNYRGQILCKIDNTNVTYAAAMVNIQELREYRSKASVYTLPYTTPEMWAGIYASLAKKYGYPKNTHIDEEPPAYSERKQRMRDLVADLIRQGVIEGP